MAARCASETNLEAPATPVRHLQGQGIDPTAMQAVSQGQYHPVASNDTAQGRAKNRSVSLLLRPR